MSTISTMRMAAIMSFTEKKGCTPEQASIAAFALHPLDNAPVPGRRFEKEARRLSRAFAKKSRSLQGESLAQEARTTLLAIKDLARTHGEDHYIDRYDKALGEG